MSCFTCTTGQELWQSSKIGVSLCEFLVLITTSVIKSVSPGTYIHTRQNVATFRTLNRLVNVMYPDQLL